MGSLLKLFLNNHTADSDSPTNSSIHNHTLFLAWSHFEGFFDPLNPKSDEHLIYPYNNIAETLI